MLHSNIGASSSKRWMTCTSSPSLIATLDPELTNTSSIFAEEGSAAHCLAELIVDEIARNNISNYADLRDGILDTPLQGIVLRKHNDTNEYVPDRNPWTEEIVEASLTSESDHEFICDEEMEECIRFYAETIMGFVDQCIGYAEVQSETLTELAYQLKSP